jgi:hypothetical protein
MSNFTENSEEQFANGQNSRDLRASAEADGPDTQLDPTDLRERTVSGDGLEALRESPGEDLSTAASNCATAMEQSSADRGEARGSVASTSEFSW